METITVDTLETSKVAVNPRAQIWPQSRELVL